MPQQVIIASANPVKLGAAKDGFKLMMPDQNFQFIPVSVDTGVSEQPMSSRETLQGSINRAMAAKVKFPNAQYWIGIEGGIEYMDGEMEVFAWIYIHTPTLKGKAKTSTFYLPKRISDLVMSGIELGEADDIVFARSNSKQNNGAVGILTNDVMDRRSYYREAVVLALIPFLNQELYLQA